MITKAIVEEVVSPYQVRVRIPTLNRLGSGSLSTKTEELNIATICSLPNCYVNPQVGDIVFVGFEDNTYYKAVVLGHLSREAMTNTYGDFNMNNIVVNASAKLPNDTQIGIVTSEELSMLSGVEANIQKQIENLREQITQLQNAVFK